MKIYISGISGTGMGPLALMARDAGFEVCGSDIAKGPIYDELIKAGIEVYIGKQDGTYLRQKNAAGKVDWFVHTSALPSGHREMAIAKLGGLRITKRDELTKVLVERLGLKMVAIAGTHGKTTTTAMIVWACLKMGLPVSYVVGTTLGFAASGAYHVGDRYFIYEADEYDRNFLKFRPWLSIITNISYDHPDIYKTREEYEQAFEEFRKGSERVIEGAALSSVGAAADFELGGFRLAGEARRYDARLAMKAALAIENDYVHRNNRAALYDPDYAGIVKILNEFPGVGRRFERLCEGIYSDYAHHPEEIEATLGVAVDECRMRGLKGVVAVYQPHQNARQYEVREGYAEAFAGFGSDFGPDFGADFGGIKKVYWLPTYLVREDPELAVLTPEELSSGVPNAVPAEMNEELFSELMRWRDEGYLVLLMTAGTGDRWLRREIEKKLEK